MHVKIYGKCENGIKELKKLSYKSIKQTHSLTVRKVWNIGSLKPRGMVSECGLSTKGNPFK